MIRSIKRIGALLALCAALTACSAPSETRRAQPDRSEASSAPRYGADTQEDLPLNELSPRPPAARTPSPGGGPPPAFLLNRTLIPLENTFVQSTADETLRLCLREETDAFECVRLVYTYLVEQTAFAEPVGLEAWRWRGDAQAPAPPYVENRALSPLLFGVGSCEDYASALTVLLWRMGFEAQYVPGLTISVRGDFVEHAWTAVRIGESWYHLDPQLERNVTREDLLTYRFFLRTDREMLADHRWGENWLDYGKSETGPLTPAQRELIETRYCSFVCTAGYAKPDPKRLRMRPAPNREKLKGSLARERAAFEKEHGPLPEMELNVAAPVFGTLPKE